MGTIFKNVKVGDKVIFFSAWYNCVATVTKVTKKQIHVGYGKYRKCDGIAVGADESNMARIEPYSEDGEKIVKQTKRKNEMAAFCRNYQYNNLPLEYLENVYNHLKEVEKVIKSLK